MLDLHYMSFQILGHLTYWSMQEGKHFTVDVEENQQAPICDAAVHSQKTGQKEDETSNIDKLLLPTPRQKNRGNVFLEVLLINKEWEWLKWCTNAHFLLASVSNWLHHAQYMS